MTPAIVACRFVIERVQAREKRRWLEGVRQPALPCRSVVPEARFVAERRLRGVPVEAARALCGWADGVRDAELWRTVPSPRELLAMSARGRRCVSLLERDDGLEFALHDLCHLEKFADPSYRHEQVGFFAVLDRAMARPEWAALEEGFDAEWARERDHVLGDMNASAVFLWCGLRSRVAQACARTGRPAQERFDRLVALCGLDPELAAQVVSRRSSREASRQLAAHFAAIGERILL